jgi:hypothetical protein
MPQMLEATSNSISTRGATGVRWQYLALLCLPLVAFRIFMFTLHAPLGDFMTYWAAGHLFLTGGDPYSTNATFAIERSYGWPLTYPLITFCPVWALPILSAMSLLPFYAAHALWFAVSLFLNCFSAIGLWLYFGGEKRKAWIALAICLTFLPMGGAELLGQITPLILACLTAFLLLVESKRYFLAGLVLVGFGPKPHLLYLVSLAILLWIVKTRAWTMLAGAITSYGAATAAAIWFNPSSTGYFHKTFGVAMDISCGIGGALRSVFGVQHLWLQFLPSLVGFGWFLVYWRKNHREWSWRAHLPLLLLVSVSTSPYCWYHDFILILPALIAVALSGAYRSPYIMAAYLVTQAAVIVTVQWSVAWMCVVSLLWIVFYLLANSTPAFGNERNPSLAPTPA